MDSVQVDSLAPPTVGHRLAVGAIVAVHQPFAVAGAAGWVSHSTTQARGRDEMRRERGQSRRCSAGNWALAGPGEPANQASTPTFRGSMSSRGGRRAPLTGSCGTSRRSRSRCSCCSRSSPRSRSSGRGRGPRPGRGCYPRSPWGRNAVGGKPSAPTLVFAQVKVVVGLGGTRQAREVFFSRGGMQGGRAGPHVTLPDALVPPHVVPPHIASVSATRQDYIDVSNSPWSLAWSRRGRGAGEPGSMPGSMPGSGWGPWAPGLPPA